MGFRMCELLSPRERPRETRGLGVSGSKRRRSALALGLGAMMVALLVTGCRAGNGVPGNPIGLKLQWFSFLDGDGFRNRCGPGMPDRYRLIYNARFDEQIRVYDVTAYFGEAIFRARAVEPGFVLTGARLNLDFGWRESKTRLSAAEYSEFRRRLQESGLHDPTPVGLELFSPDFYWVGMSCEGGRFHYTAYARPSPAFDALTFPAFLFVHDETGLPVNPPRDIPASERLRALGGGLGPPQDRYPAFRMVVDEDGIEGDYGLF